MMVVRRADIVVIVVLLLLAGCSEEPAGDADAGGPDAEPQEDADTHVDPPAWTTGTVVSGAVGLYPTLDVSAHGDVGLVYFGLEPVEGDTCTEVGSDDPPQKSFWTLYFSGHDQSVIAGADTLDGLDWSTEEVADILSLSQPRGLDFAFSPDGTAMITTRTGEPVEQPPYCGANDVGVLSRQGAADWSLETAVSSSGEAATGEAGSDYGEVVGYWPSLAFDAAGEPVIAYKDIHGGGLQGDDRRRADLELAWRSGSWSAEPVDWGRGAGDFNSLAVDAQQRPVIAYYNPVESQADAQLGVWVARRPAVGADFEYVHLFSRATSRGPSLVVDPDDDMARLVFYNSEEGFPQLATQVSDADFESISEGWELSDIGNALYDEGYTPSLAVDPDGRLAVAYYRCTEVLNGLGNCSAGDDALIFAHEDAGHWTHEVVDPGEQGLCGRNPSLVFDTDGAALIAYECEDEVDGALESQIKIARRQPL